MWWGDRFRGPPSAPTAGGWWGGAHRGRRDAGGNQSGRDVFSQGDAASHWAGDREDTGEGPRYCAHGKSLGQETGDVQEWIRARNHSTGKHADGVGGAEQVGRMRREGSGEEKEVERRCLLPRSIHHSTHGKNNTLLFRSVSCKDFFFFVVLFCFLKKP